MHWDCTSYEELLVRQYRPAFQRAMGPVSEELIGRVVERFQFREAVPKDVTDRFATASEMLRWSGRRPKRIRAAFEFVVNTLELALRMRYRQLQDDGESLHSPRPGEPDKAKRLVDWHAKRGHFEAPRQMMLILVALRNHAMHLNMHSYSRLRELEYIGLLAEEIDHLYEEPARRRERAERWKRLDSRLDGVTDGGATLEVGRARTVIYTAAAVAYENRVSPPRYWLLFYPIERRIDEETRMVPPPFFAECASWQNMPDGSLQFETLTGNALDLHRLLSRQEQAQWGRWQNNSDLRAFSSHLHGFTLASTSAAAWPACSRRPARRSLCIRPAE